MNTTMKQGDFTGLAKDYAMSRPDYSPTVLRALLSHTGARNALDVGAGTGIWTRMLAKAGLECQAVEPCESMREEGKAHTADYEVSWRAGSAEETGLEDGAVDWVTMASSFHWTDSEKSLPEFHRVLKTGGLLTVLWNPRNIAGHTLHEEIEQLIHDMVPDLKRVSSGSSKHTSDWQEVLVSTGHFKDVIFMEANHEIAMSKERYLQAWRSVNDIQAQAGPELFNVILDSIEGKIDHLDKVVVPYKTRAWTAAQVRA